MLSCKNEDNQFVNGHFGAYFTFNVFFTNATNRKRIPTHALMDYPVFQSIIKINVVAVY